MHYFTFEDISVLLRLVIAHLVADFYLQRNDWIKSKVEKNLASPFLWIHAGIAAFGAWIVLWDINYWWVFGITFITHLPTDAWKIWATNKVMADTSLTEQRKAEKELRLFITDQIIHFIVILVIWLLLINKMSLFGEQISRAITNYRFLLFMTGYLIVLNPTGFLVGNITKRWLPELNMKDSLYNAGTWIGLLERTIVLTFIYANQFSAIGFLIAAKSILRVTDKPEPNSNDIAPFSSRKHTEYVLIGTFLSFGIALLVGLSINYLLGL